MMFSKQQATNGKGFDLEFRCRLPLRTDPFGAPATPSNTPPRNAHLFRQSLGWVSSQPKPLSCSPSPIMSTFGSRRPTQQLNIACNDCGAITVRFESFVADGAIFEMVGNKLSEMMAFLSASPELVRCTSCTEKAVAAAEAHRQRERDRIRQQMELKPSSEPHAQPAMYEPATFQ